MLKIIQFWYFKGLPRLPPCHTTSRASLQGFLVSCVFHISLLILLDILRVSATAPAFARELFSQVRNLELKLAPDVSSHQLVIDHAARLNSSHRDRKHDRLVLCQFVFRFHLETNRLLHYLRVDCITSKTPLPKRLSSSLSNSWAALRTIS